MSNKQKRRGPIADDLVQAESQLPTGEKGRDLMPTTSCKEKLIVTTLITPGWLPKYIIYVTWCHDR